MRKNIRIYLASASPRRQELLHQLGLEFDVMPSNILEVRKPGESPAEYVMRVAGDKVIVQNVNIIKRHTKPNPQANVAGGIVERGAPIHISNVMLFNQASGKGERIGFKVLENGRKVRVFRSSGEAVDA